MAENSKRSRISKVEVTTETLSARAGMVGFSRYLQHVGIFGLLLEKFSKVKKTRKGVELGELFKQWLCFFAEGSSYNLSHFDNLQEDEGYAAVIESRVEDMASSHTMKRFLRAFGVWAVGGFRWVLKRLFLWRLRLKQPAEIILGIDTMVMDNDGANQREGVAPTYKQAKGFQPYQVTWEGKIIDGIFRRGDKHSNHAGGALQVLRQLVDFIRRHYSKEVPILVRMDAGFFDEKIFKGLDELGVMFLAGGKLYDWVHQKAEEQPEGQWSRYQKGKQVWQYTEIDYQCKDWKGSYRGFYSIPLFEEDQKLLEIGRPVQVFVTNITSSHPKIRAMSAQEQQRWLSSQALMESYHQRGSDELPHRALKDFGTQQLPLKRFNQNRAYYYLMLVAFFLFECYKEDGLKGVVPAGSYASTVRRAAFDFAGKVVRTSNQLILKVHKTVMSHLKLPEVLDRIAAIPPIGP